MKKKDLNTCAKLLYQMVKAKCDNDEVSIFIVELTILITDTQRYIDKFGRP